MVRFDLNKLLLIQSRGSLACSTGAVVLACPPPQRTSEHGQVGPGAANVSDQQYQSLPYLPGRGHHGGGYRPRQDELLDSLGEALVLVGGRHEGGCPPHLLARVAHRD